MGFVPILMGLACIDGLRTCHRALVESGWIKDMQIHHQRLDLFHQFQINRRSNQVLKKKTFAYLTWLAIKMGSRSHRTSFKSGDHFADKTPVTITSSEATTHYWELLCKQNWIAYIQKVGNFILSIAEKLKYKTKIIGQVTRLQHWEHVWFSIYM